MLLAVPIAYAIRSPSWFQRALTTVLVVPITLGTVLIAEGLLTYLGPQGWLNRTLLLFGLVDSPIRLVHNYWGVLLAIIISGFPVHLPADPVLHHRHRPVAAARRGDAGRRPVRAVPPHLPAAADAGRQRSRSA